MLRETDQFYRFINAILRLNPRRKIFPGITKKSIFIFFVHNFHVSYSNSICSLDICPISSKFFLHIPNIPLFKKLGTLVLNLFSVVFFFKIYHKIGIIIFVFQKKLFTFASPKNKRVLGLYMLLRWSRG